MSVNTRTLLKLSGLTFSVAILCTLLGIALGDGSSTGGDIVWLMQMGTLAATIVLLVASGLLAVSKSVGGKP